jgi:DNA-binding NtrC family response regulator
MLGAQHFTGFTRRAVEALLNYDFPGNIRELQNLIERGVIYAEDGRAIDAGHMFRRGELLRTDVFSLGSKGGLQQWSDKEVALDGTQSRKTSATTSAADHHSLIVRALENGGGLKQLESNAYDAALAKTRGNVSAAARLLGITRAQLDYRLGKRCSGSRKRLSHARA